MQRREFVGRASAYALAAAGSGGPMSALAQDKRTYPTRPIQIVVPFAAGGPTDILARAVGQPLGTSLGQTLVVINKPGAGGNIGTEQVAHAEPDGYTLLLVASSHAINPAVYERVPFDPIRDFTPLSLLATGPFVLTVKPSVPANSVTELIALARRKPGSLTYASAGSGTANHLAGELFKQMAGIDMTHVPYNGAAPASQAIASGEVDLFFNNMLSGLPMIKAERVRALAVTGPKRSSALPQLPTIAESGLPGFDVQTWYAILGPAGMSPQIATLLSRQIAAAVADPHVRTLANEQGLDSIGSDGPTFARFLADEVSRWAKVAKVSGARAS